MNKRELRRKIIAAAQPPPPVKKSVFMRSLPVKYADFHSFVLMQPAFIRKRLWLAAAAFALLAAACLKILGAAFTQETFLAVWAISAAAPFFALAAVCELFASEEYGMSEIENACRFGKSQLAAARILTVGILTFAVMSAVTLAVGIFTPLDIAGAVMYIFTPYSLAAGLFMEVLNRFRGRDGLFVCSAAAAFISILGVSGCSAPGCSAPGRSAPVPAYLAAIVLGAVFTVVNTLKLLKGGEFHGAYD